MEENGT
jgi:hypothetical protein